MGRPSTPSVAAIREAAQEFLDAHPGALISLCSQASHYLWERGLGLRMVFGTYGFSRDPHVWNEDEFGTVYDLTREQFVGVRELAIVPRIEASSCYYEMPLENHPESMQNLISMVSKVAF